MRSLLLVFGLMIVSLPQFETHAAEEVVGQALPAPMVITPELVEAHYQFQAAQLRLQQYRNVELPRYRKLLDSQVQLSQSEIHVLRRRVRDYRQFLEVDRYSPVRTAAENDWLALQASEQQLSQLRDERLNLMRYSRQHSQLYQLEVLRAAARVQQVINQSAVVD